MSRHSDDRPEYQGSRPAFTLVEVLVVIGILVILLSLLFPAISKARSTATFIQCKSNLRQIANGIRMYANDNRDHYPDAYTLGGAFFRRAPGERNPADPSSVPEKYGLPAILRLYVGSNPDLWICPAAPEWMKDYKSTYLWALNWDALGGMTSAQRRQAKYRDVFFVSDNYSNLPYLTGVRRGKTDPNPILPATKFLLPHSYLVKVRFGATNPNARRGAANVMFLDGSIGTALHTDNPANPAGPPLMIVSR